MIHIRDIDEIHNKVVLVRAGLNVPLDAQGTVADDFRIQKIMPTITYLQEQGAKVIVLGHIGRDLNDSLSPVAQYISHWGAIVFKENFFAPDVYQNNLQELTQELETAASGTVYLLDNVRQNEKELLNDSTMAQGLAKIVDVYVNEAFSVSHREHMSVSALPRACAIKTIGFAFAQEIEHLVAAIDPPQKSVAIVGGNKFATKLPLINKLADTYNTVIVAGALANTLYHVAGYEIGRSVYDADMDNQMYSQLQELLRCENIFVPAIVQTENSQGEVKHKHVSELAADDAVYDAAAESFAEIEQEIQAAQLCIWNGPLGYYEQGYTQGSEFILDVINNTDGSVIVGGGNTVDLARGFASNKNIFLSTGGGAMIDFITQGTLPGLEALKC